MGKYDNMPPDMETNGVNPPAVPLGDKAFRVWSPAMALQDPIAQTQMFELAKREAKLSCMASGIKAEDNPSEWARRQLLIITGKQMFGLTPQQSVSLLYLINDKIAMAAELQRALVFASGMCETWEMKLDTQKLTASLHAKRRDNGAEITRRALIAEFSHLRNKQDSAWNKYPLQMLQARVTSWVVTAIFSDIILGVISIEEAEEISNNRIERPGLSTADLVGVAELEEGAQIEAESERMREIEQHSESTQEEVPYEEVHTDEVVKNPPDTNVDATETSADDGAEAKEKDETPAKAEASETPKRTSRTRKTGTAKKGATATKASNKPKSTQRTSKPKGGTQSALEALKAKQKQLAGSG